MQRRNITERLEAFVGEEISLDTPGDIFCEELTLRFDRRGGESEEPVSKKMRLEDKSEADEETDEEDEANDLFGNDDDTDVLTKAHQFIIFLRYYDPSVRKLVHLGNSIFRARDTFGAVLSKVRKVFLPDLDDDVQLKIGELLTPVQLMDKPLSETLQDASIQNGDIFYIERVEKKALRELDIKENSLGLQAPSRAGHMTLADWMNHRIHAVSVRFFHVKAAASVTLQMYAMDKYEQVVTLLNKELLAKVPDLADQHDNGMRIRLCKTSVGGHEIVPFDANKTLRRIAMPCVEELKSRQLTLHWEVLPCRVDQLADHVILKLLVLDGYNKAEEKTVAMQAKETVKDLVETVRNLIEGSAEGSVARKSRKIRVFRTYNGQFDQMLHPHESLPRMGELQAHSTTQEGSISAGVCRIIAEVDEEDVGESARGPVEKEELEGEGEGEVPVAEAGRLCLVTHAFVDERSGKLTEFYYPFTMRIRSTDTVGTVRERIRKRSKIPEAEFKSLKFVGFKAGGFGEC